MSIELSSVLTALTSPMVPSVTGTNNQVASPHGCFPGLTGPEPSGPLINPGQHLQALCGQDDVARQKGGRGFSQCMWIGLAN